jgi:uncharacterized protein
MNTKQLKILVPVSFLTLYLISTTMFHDDFHDGWNAYENKDYKTAFKLWLPLAEQENSRAQFFLGQIYEKGQGVPQDYAEATKWYQHAAKLGYASAKPKIYKFARMGVAPALKVLKSDAKQGVAVAQINLGEMHEKGNGVQQDYNEAFKWLQYAAEQGYDDVKPNIYGLARKGVPSALEFLRNDAKQGVMKAQLQLGQMNERGQDAPPDFNEAFKWYQLALKQGNSSVKPRIYGLAQKGAPSALEFLRSDAKQGVAEAQLHMGIMHEKGKAVLRDYNEAFKWYQLAAKQGAPSVIPRIYALARKGAPSALEFLRSDAKQGVAEAQLHMGMRHEKGKAVLRDYNEAFKWYQLAAKQGNPSAKLRIYTLAGKGVAPALKILQDDAKQGVAEAQILLGQVHEKGQGVLIDYNEAFKWYQLALKQGYMRGKSFVYRIAKRGIAPALKILQDDAKLGIPLAQIFLGGMHGKGHGVAKNYNEAFKWYTLATMQDLAQGKYVIYLLAKKGAQIALKVLQHDAKKGLPDAQYYFGQTHENGKGVPQDLDEAFKWYQLALEQGFNTAKRDIYRIAKRGVAPALKILQDDAKQGIAKAQFMLGQMHEKGEGFPQNNNEAFKWYRLAAEQRDSKAQVELGKIYEEGKSVPQNYKKAFKWYQFATEQENRSGQFHLGAMYIKGKGVPQDHNKAMLWYQIAAMGGNVQAQIELGKIYEEGKLAPQNYNQAFKWYHASAETGNPTGQLNLGIMYYKGVGVPQDYELAYKWFIISSLQENQEAKKYALLAEKKISPQQKEKIQEIARNWEP